MPPFAKQPVHSQPARPLAAALEVCVVAAPAKVLQRPARFDEFGPRWIEMDVVADGAQVTAAAAIHVQGLVASGKEMAAELVSNIKTLGVNAQQPLHAGD